jgi:hypothetical protein
VEEIRTEPAKPFGVVGAAGIAARAVMGRNVAG